MRLLTSTLVIFSLIAVSLTAHQSYENYKVYQVTPKNAQQGAILKGFQKFNNDIDFWTKFRALDQAVDVMVSPKLQLAFRAALTINRIEFIELISNVEKLFENERMRQNKSPKIENGKISFTEYHHYDIIQAYIKQLSKDHKGIVTVTAPAISHESREVNMIKISTGGETAKPAILIDGGIHAREWISPATVVYIINQLVENEENRFMIENIDWYIIPVLNPDGYEFTFNSYRLWRKTRSNGTECYGVDGNRNFDFHWMETGGSANQCDETYAGPTPLSEPEMEAITSVVAEHGSEIKLYLTFHSYGQYLLYPWGFTEELPDDWEELDTLGRAVDDAISAVNGTKYTVGSITNVLYAAAGGSDDWIKGVGGVELAYTIELPGGGSDGFDLPPERIAPVVEETWEGVKVFYQYVVDKFV